MKRRFKGIQIFLVIAISFFILAFPAYLRNTGLLQTKLASWNLSFENPDQEQGLTGNEKGLKVYGLSTLLIMFLWSTNLFEQSCNLFSHTLSPHQKTSVLRR